MTSFPPQAYGAHLVGSVPLASAELVFRTVAAEIGNRLRRVDGTARRLEAALRFVSSFGIATECGWGRRAPATIPELLRIHRELGAPVHQPGRPRRRFEWPSGFQRIPDEDWTRQSLDTFGLRYDTVENHGWYRNLDPTVDDLARHLALRLPGDGGCILHPPILVRRASSRSVCRKR